MTEKRQGGQERVITRPEVAGGRENRSSHAHTKRHTNSRPRKAVARERSGGAGLLWRERES